MIPTATELARARFVRAVLEWHGHEPADLAELLDVGVTAVYKKLDGKRSFTSRDLERIAAVYGADPALLLQPAPAARVLGEPATSGSESGCIRPFAGQRALAVAA